MNGKPSNQILYNQVKERIYSKMDKNSIYRSAQIQKVYKELGGTYTGKKENNIKGWYSEDWVNLNDYVRGKITKCGDGNTMKQYNEYKLCRPRKIAEQIPKSDIKLMIKEKTKIKSKPLLTSKILGTKKYNIKKIGQNI
jgi:hypothetical protein